MIRLIALLLLALNVWAQSSTTITLLPLTNSSGTPTEPGKLIFRDLGLGASLKTVTVVAPDAVMASYKLKWPDTLTSGCMSNAASGTTGTLSFSPCLTNPLTSDLAVSSDNTYTIGEALTSTTRKAPSFIYASTGMEAPEFNFAYYSGGSIIDNWAIKADGNGVLGVLDSAGATILRYIDIPTSKWMFYHNVDPNADNSIDLGDTFTAWKKLWTYDARVKSMAGSGTRCVQVDNNGDLSVAAAGCAASTGANVFLSNLSSPTAINQSLFFDTDNTYYIGEAPTSTTRVAPNTIYASTAMESPKYILNYIPAGSITDSWSIEAGGTGVLDFNDSSHNPVLKYINVPTSQWMFYANTLPAASNTYDLGASTALWRKSYAVNARVSALGGSGTRCMQVDNNGDLGIAGAGCGTVSSVTASSPLSSSGGATPNITIQQSTTSQNGYLSSTDWNTFNGKMANPMTSSGDMIVGGSSGTPGRLAVSGLGGNNFLMQVGASSPSWVNAIFSSPLAFSGGVFSISQATTSTNGYLSSTDWNTFNGKITNPMTTSGDLIVGGSSGTPSRIAVNGLGGTNILMQQGAGAPAWQNMLFSSPISYSSGILSCSTCVTTAGGQTIAGTTTLSTISVSTAISGTYNLSGNETVTGNWYARSFSGSDISCSGVADGWMGWDYTNQYLIMCAGEARYRVNLTLY
jgi:hypothetical protein